MFVLWFLCSFQRNQNQLSYINAAGENDTRFSMSISHGKMLQNRAVKVVKIPSLVAFANFS